MYYSHINDIYNDLLKIKEENQTLRYTPFCILQLVFRLHVINMVHVYLFQGKSNFKKK